MDNHYYLTVGSDQKGPYTLSQLQTMWRAGSITADTLYCQQGFDEWVSISSLAELLDAPPVRSSSPASLATHPALAASASDKRILPAFLLCLFFGSFGAHAFYAGRVGQGVMYLAFIVLALLALFSLNSALGVPLALLVMAVCLLGDVIRIIAGGYKDGKGCKITRWT